MCGGAGITAPGRMLPNKGTSVVYATAARQCKKKGAQKLLLRPTSDSGRNLVTREIRLVWKPSRNSSVMWEGIPGRHLRFGTLKSGRRRLVFRAGKDTYHA